MRIMYAHFGIGAMVSNTTAKEPGPTQWLRVFVASIDKSLSIDQPLAERSSSLHLFAQHFQFQPLFLECCQRGAFLV